MVSEAGGSDADSRPAHSFFSLLSFSFLGQASKSNAKLKVHKKDFLCLYVHGDTLELREAELKHAGLLGE